MCLSFLGTSHSVKLIDYCLDSLPPLLMDDLFLYFHLFQGDDKKTTSPEQESRTVSTSSSNLSLPSNNNNNTLYTATTPSQHFQNATQGGSTHNVYQIQDESYQQVGPQQYPQQQLLGIPHHYPGNPYLQKTPIEAGHQQQQLQHQHRCDSLQCCRTLHTNGHQSGFNSQTAVVSHSQYRPQPSCDPRYRPSLNSHVIGPSQNYNHHLEVDFQTKYIQHLNRFILQSDLNVGNKQYPANHREAVEFPTNHSEAPTYQPNSDVTAHNKFNYF